MNLLPDVQNYFTKEHGVTCVADFEKCFVPGVSFLAYSILDGGRVSQTDSAVTVSYLGEGIAN